MKVGSAFTGIGGFDLGFERAGAKIAWQIEIDPTCQRVLKKHWPDVRLHDDIRTATQAGLEPVDVLTAGWPCFPAGTLVLCRDGFKPIEEVQVGDEVLTHRGRFQRVVRTMKRQAETVILQGYGHPLMKTTPNHPFYASKRMRVWNNARRNYDVVFADPVWVSASEMKGKYWASPVEFPVMEVPPIEAIGNETSVPEITPQLMWVIGAWLGDGWAEQDDRRGRVTICCSQNENEADILEKRIEAAGLHATRVPQRTTIRFIISSRAFARWLTQHFGKGAEGKKLPTWALGMKKEFREALLDGYRFADGSDYKDGFRITTISKSLAIGMKLLAQSLGWNVCLYRYEIERDTRIEGWAVNEKPQWQIVAHSKSRSAFRHKNYVFGLVRSITPGGVEWVYDLTVETDHSFLADGLVVHNCQDLSIAGKRQGLSGARSGLFFDLCRLIEQLRPTWLVLENVPGLLSSNGGRDMGAVLGALEELGYSVAWRVLDAQYYGVPQRRRRVIFVGYLGDNWRAPAAVLFDSASCAWHSAPRREAGSTVASLLASGAGTSRPAGIASEVDFLVPGVAGTLGGGSGRRGWCDDLDRCGAFIPAIARALKAGGNDRHDESHETYILHTATEVAPTLHGFVHGSNPAFQDEAVVAHALTAKDGIRHDPSSETYVTHREMVYAMANRPRPVASENVMPTLEAKGDGGRMEVVSYVIQDVRGRTRDRTDHKQGIGMREGDTCYTLNATEQHAVTYTPLVTSGPKMFDAAGYHREKVSDTTTPTLTAFEQPMLIQPIVRRITPKEGERLQGFPDDWTRWDTEGKEISDSARYRLLGNAVAVPVVEWVARRLMAVDAILRKGRQDA